ncbi:hypothetical protein [Gayadomonas joobiniege]|uniref:hypothetical protein n=1 Tax=Gayadomonas joobiniege TaxID=1234606 RepID=UPI0003784C2C|nr:hypothetical protein [Gayadomonas joobiniege]
MKESLSIHEFLVDPQDLAEQHEDFELAADNYNQIVHLLYQTADDEIAAAELNAWLESLWFSLAADEYLTEFEDENEMMLWVENFIALQTNS